MKSKIFPFAAAAILAATSSSFAATVITTADAKVWKGTNGNTNYGSDAGSTSLHAQDYLATSSLLVYVQFDLSAYVPGSFTSATLSLTSAAAASAGAVGKPVQIHGLNNSENADGWGEGTITYNNAPGLTIGGGVATLDIDGTKTDLLGTANQVAAGNTFSFTDPNLLSFLNADTDGIVTLILGATAVPQDPAFLWDSKEVTPGTDADAPLLTIEGTLVPEPSSACLLGLGGLALLLRRRR